MQRLSSAKFLIAASVAIGAPGAASAAQARTDVHLSIGVPFGYVQPAPVYVQPAPVYHQPRPVYHQPRPVYVQPAPVHVYPSAYHRGHDRRGAWGDADRDGVPNIHDRHHNDRRGHHGGWRDSDRDGVPNRHDRAPHNSHRR